MTPEQFIDAVCEELNIQHSAVIHNKSERYVEFRYGTDEFADSVVGPASVAAAIVWHSIALMPREMPVTDRDENALFVKVRY